MESFVSAGVWLILFTNFVCLSLIIYLFRSPKKPVERPISEPSSPSFPNPSTKPSSRKLSISDSLRAYNSEPRNIYRICITGGPCAGKTTALTRVSERLSELGIRTYLVPEAATMLMRGGAMINMQHFTRAQKMKFQMNLLRLQMNLEDIFIDIARSNCKVGQAAVVLCDRGVMDGSAYIEPELWQAMLDETSWSVVHLRDSRYEAVIHMVTAANGAEEFYNSSSNEARYEDLENARHIDLMIQQAWTGHPYMWIIDNNVSSFDEKLHKCVEQVCKYVGLQAPIMSYYKFLVKIDSLIPVHVQELTLEETFLNCNPSVIDRITKRGREHSFTYVHTITQKDTRKTVSKNQLSSREYMILLDRADKSRKTLERKRQCFVWDMKYFALDTFVNVKDGICVLRIETESKPKFPPFLELVRDVTEDPGYSSYNLAKVDWYISAQDVPSLA